MENKPPNIFRLKKACADCPFRADVHPYLTVESAQEKADSLRDGYGFHCHKTLDYGTDTGIPENKPGTQMCAGAIRTLQAEHNENLIMSLGRMLGNYDEKTLADDTAPIYGGLNEWVDSYKNPYPKRDSGQGGAVAT